MWFKGVSWLSLSAVLTLVSSVIPESMPEIYIDLCFLCYHPIKNVLAFISTATLGMLAQLFWFHQTWEVKTKARSGWQICLTRWGSKTHPIENIEYLSSQQQCALCLQLPPPPWPSRLILITHFAHLTWRTFHFHQIDTVNTFQSWRKTLHLPHQYPSLVSSFILAETDSIHSTWQVPRLGWGQHTFTHETNESRGQWQRRTPSTE